MHTQACGRSAVVSHQPQPHPSSRSFVEHDGSCSTQTGGVYRPTQAAPHLSPRASAPPDWGACTSAAPAAPAQRSPACLHAGGMHGCWATRSAAATTAQAVGGCASSCCLHWTQVCNGTRNRQLTNPPLLSTQLVQHQPGVPRQTLTAAAHLQSRFKSSPSRSRSMRSFLSATSSPLRLSRAISADQDGVGKKHSMACQWPAAAMVPCCACSRRQELDCRLTLQPASKPAKTATCPAYRRFQMCPPRCA